MAHAEHINYFSSLLMEDDMFFKLDMYWCLLIIKLMIFYLRSCKFKKSFKQFK